ncbi:hypothetical protein AD998_08920 [bacterium 336/3]|nr:hypothetical protein AD998_08920 [bacterium 336/3]
MKRTLKQIRNVLTALLCSASIGYAQNLVQNPSFEQGTIPTGQSQLHLATNWTHYKGDCIANNPNIPSTWPSSDLFDKNATSSSVGVPSNVWTTSAGLDERTGQRRYAGIWNQVDQTFVNDERIRGTLTTTLQAGSYDLSLYLARGKNHLTPSTLDPVTKYQVEVVLRKGTDCSLQKLIYISPSLTNYQWQQYATTFSIIDSEANIYNRVEIRIKHFTFSQFESRPNVRTVFIDDVSITPIVCTLNPAYSYSIGCDKQANQAVIDVIGNVVNQNSQWNLYEMNGNSIADQDIISGPNPIQVLSGHQVQFRVPNVAGKYYMIKHGVWTNMCSWVEQRRVFQIPTFNNYVNSDFTMEFQSPVAGGAPSIEVTSADFTNPVSNWMLFYSYSDLPITSLNGWTYAGVVTSTNTHTFSNLQYGVYYMVRHISKHNCSTYGYTHKKVYGYAQRMANNTTLEALDIYAGKMTEEEYVAFEKMIQQEQNNIQNPIKLYPNPATSVVNIAKNTSVGEHKVTITNQFGKQMYEGILSNEMNINVSSWRKGLYFVNVHTANGIKVEKLLVE